MANWDISTAAASLEFNTDHANYHSSILIDENHIINVTAGAASDGEAQVFTVNTTTWAVTTAAALLEFDTRNAQYNSLLKIDTNHFIDFYRGNDGSVANGDAQVFTVNTTTWAVTTASARLVFDTRSNSFNTAAQIDDNHFINFWYGQSSTTPLGYVQVFTVNTTTWAVTTASAFLNFQASSGGDHDSVAKIDTNHFVNFWSGSGDDGFAQVFTVNTTTWAVTTAASTLEFDTQNALHNSVFKIDDNHFINFWQGSSDLHYRAQVFAVNTTTWAVSTSGAVLEIDAAAGSGEWGNKESIEQIDENHFLTAWGTSDDDGFTRVVEVNTSTWGLTLVGTASLEFDTQFMEDSSIVKIDTSHYVYFWSGNGGDGFVQAFTVVVPAASTDVTVNAGVQALTFTQPAPTITPVRNVTISPNVQTLLLTQPAPTVTVAIGITVSPDAQTTTLTQPSPSVSTIRSVTVSPNAQTGTLSQPSPTVSTVRNITVSPSAQTDTFTQPVPTVSPVRNITISPDVQSAAFSQPTASVSISESLSVNPQTITFTQPSLTITAIRNVSVSANPQTATFSQPSIGISVGDSVTLATESLTFTQPVPTVSTTRNVTVSLNAQTVSFTQPTASVSTIRNVTVSPSVQSLSFTQPAPTVSVTGDVTVSPSVQTVVFTQPTPVITAIKNVTVSPSAQIITFTQPSATTTAIRSVNISADTQELTFSTPSVSVSTYAEVSLTPNPLSLSFRQPAPLVIATGWVDGSDPSSSWNNTADPSTLWTDTVNPETTFTPVSDISSSWTDTTDPTTSWS